MAQRGAPGAQAPPRSAATSVPSHRMRPALGSLQAVDHAQQGRLAGAGAADHAHQLPRGDGGRYGIDGALVAKALGYLLQAKHFSPPSLRSVTDTQV